MVCRKKDLAIRLQLLDLIEHPKVELEQYCTPPDIAAELVHMVGMDTDVRGKSVLDLGCGSGILGLGMVVLGASKLVGIDIDGEVLEAARRNGSICVDEEIEFYQHDVKTLERTDLPELSRKFDVVISNPPFGTRECKIDQVFVEKGLMFSDVVYSVHKYSTRQFWKTKARELGAEVDVVIPELRFPIKKTFSFHKHRVMDVQVQFIKFVRTHSRKSSVASAEPRK